MPTHVLDLMGHGLVRHDLAHVAVSTAYRLPNGGLDGTVYGGYERKRTYIQGAVGGNVGGRGACCGVFGRGGW